MRRKSSTRNLIQRQIRSSIHIIDVGFEPGPLRLIPHFLFQLNRRGAGARREGDRNQHSLESTLLIQRLVRTLC